MNSSKSPSGTFGLCSVLPQAFKTCLGHSEHDSKACLAIDHSFVCFLGFCKRKCFDHWTDICEYAEIKRVLSLIALPVRLPTTDRPPKISGTPLTGMASPETPTTASLPRVLRPGIKLPIAAPLGAVARMTSAPPSFCSAAAASCALASM